LEQIKTKHNTTVQKKNSTNYKKKHPYSFSIIKNKNEIIGFITIIPCNKDLMNQFLNKEITEKELIKNIKTKITKKNIETLYVMSAYIHKDHRTKGIATNTIIKMISYYQKEYENIELFA